MSNVKLGIRVRPFTERETRSDKEKTQVVHVIDNSTVSITNVKVSVSGAGDSRTRVRNYSVDYAFDSASPPFHPTYASQEKVFNIIGRAVVDGVTRGCSACVLAYGQSATGKTYTMMGTEDDPGLIPRMCKALAEEQPFEITVSFLEIYNERVHDLLAGESAPPTCHSLPRRRGNARKDLRVREHPNKGPYVQNLRRVAIASVQDLLALVTEGARRRRTAATRRNSSSSRSHALLELATPTATIHLADLAGSEKSGWEGCGGRQKEGANINKSLVALSNVISALVNGGSGRSKFVPYRDSALTWLLKDCFTGGASTYIIATVSPSVACYGESASTLRWAARARLLPTVPTASTTLTSRDVYQTQYTQLVAELARDYIRYVPETRKLTYEDKHWQMKTGHSESLVCSSEVANIGNIMNLVNPKADHQSESTASSAASGSSDVINVMDKNMSKEICEEMDKLFVPPLERTQSNSDLKVIAPLRHKRRQYKSQEVLPIDEKLHINVLPSHSETQINNGKDKAKSHQIPILYDSQRAEIVASVTERLYNKIKKKEEAVASKMEAVIDKKIMEPLNELRICTNARQRLVDLSQKALRNKRRIGIPAHTQTRKLVTRVRDQSTDVQSDLEMYYHNDKSMYTIKRDVATETVPQTPRCKEAAVGSSYSAITSKDRSTLTETKKPLYVSSLVMTEIVSKNDCASQTQVLPPPRRNKRSCCCKCVRDKPNIQRRNEMSDSIISINISQSYSVDTESQSSDDSSENQIEHSDKISSLNMTPDLLSNHNTTDINLDDSSDIKEDSIPVVDPSPKQILKSTMTPRHKVNSSETSLDKASDDFSDTDECVLPLVKVDYDRKVSPDEIKNIIMGRNENTYPYNIILSPPRGKDDSKRLVKFRDNPPAPAPVVSVSSQTTWHASHQSNTNLKTELPTDNNIDSSIETHSVSDSMVSESSKADSFIWKNGQMINNKQNNMTNSLGKKYTPVYKSNSSKYAKAKAKLYREFLGLDRKHDVDNHDAPSFKATSEEGTSEDNTEEMSYSLFNKRRNYFEDNLNFRDSHSNFSTIEQKILNTCNSLESSVKKYENYVSSYRRSNDYLKRDSLTPSEYLHHLVKLRREVVRGDYGDRDVKK